MLHLYWPKTSFTWVPPTDCLELFPLLWNSPLEMSTILLCPCSSFLLVPSMFPPGLVCESLHQQVIPQRWPWITQVWPWDQCSRGDRSCLACLWEIRPLVTVTAEFFYPDKMLSKPKLTGHTKKQFKIRASSFRRCWRLSHQGSLKLETNLCLYRMMAISHHLDT